MINTKLCDIARQVWQFFPDTIKLTQFSCVQVNIGLCFTKSLSSIFNFRCCELLIHVGNADIGGVT
jgi:hypothetical protein